MKFHIGEIYKRLSTDLNFGYWLSIMDMEDLRFAGFVESSNSLGCGAVSLGFFFPAF
jgi:hypothetical protein